MATVRNLHGKWALVTGASSGIGLEFCRFLSEMGCNLVMVSNQPKELSETANYLRDTYRVKILYENLDLTSFDATEKVLALLEKNSVIPKLLINNAGISEYKM